MEWIEAGRPLPLVVSRARYDTPFPRSWEVLYYDTPEGGQAPIAEFTEWQEAQNWAARMARQAAELARG